MEARGDRAWPASRQLEPQLELEPCLQLLPLHRRVDLVLGGLVSGLVGDSPLQLREGPV